MRRIQLRRLGLILHGNKTHARVRVRPFLSSDATHKSDDTYVRVSDGATSNGITNTNARDLITNMGISTGVNEVIIESPFEELQINGWEET